MKKICRISLNGFIRAEYRNSRILALVFRLPEVFLPRKRPLSQQKIIKRGEPDFLFVFMGEKKKWKSDKFVMKKSSKCHVGQVYLFLETKRRKKDGNSKNRKPDKSVWKR